MGGGSPRLPANSAPALEEELERPPVSLLREDRDVERSGREAEAARGGLGKACNRNKSPIETQEKEGQKRGKTSRRAPPLPAPLAAGRLHLAPLPRPDSPQPALQLK